MRDDEYRCVERFASISRVREICQITLLAPIAIDVIKLISIYDPV